MTPEPRDAIGEQLSAYLDGEGTPEERAAVEALLEADPDARALLAELQSAADALRGLSPAPAPPDVFEAISARIERDALLADVDEPVRLARHKRRPLRSLLAVAAMLVVAVGGGLYVSSELARTTPHEASVALVEPTSPPEESFGVRLQSDVQSKSRRKSPGVGGSLRQERQGIADASNAEMGDELLAPSTPPSALELRDLDSVIARLTQPATEFDAKEAGVPRSDAEDFTVDGDMSAIAAEPEITDDTLLAFGEVLADEDSLRATAPASPPVPESVLDTETQRGRSIAGRSVDVKKLNAQKQRLVVDGRTLERKLAQSVDRTEIAAHRFENEPVRLTLHTATQAEQAELVARIEVFLDRWQAAPLAAVAFDTAETTAGTSAGGLVERVQQALAPPVARLWYHQGVAGVNFPADHAATRQLIARIPPEALPALITRVAQPEADSVRLAIGGLAADDATSANQLARRTVAPAPAGETETAVAYRPSPGDLIGWMNLFGYSPSLEEGPLLARAEPTQPRRGVATQRADRRRARAVVRQEIQEIPVAASESAPADADAAQLGVATTSREKAGDAPRDGYEMQPSAATRPAADAADAGQSAATPAFAPMLPARSEPAALPITVVIEFVVDAEVPPPASTQPVSAPD